MTAWAAAALLIYGEGGREDTEDLLLPRFATKPVSTMQEVKCPGLFPSFCAIPSVPKVLCIPAEEFCCP